MKKLIAMLLALAMIFCLVACSSSSDKTADASQTQTTQETKTEDSSTSNETESSSSDAVDTVKIGVFAAVSGVNSESGRQATLAAETAEWYINEVLGGISSLGGAKVETVMIDSTSDPSTASLPLEPGRVDFRGGVWYDTGSLMQREIA